MALSAELLGDGQYEGSTIAGVVGRRLLFIDAGAFFGMNAMCPKVSCAALVTDPAQTREVLSHPPFLISLSIASLRAPRDVPCDYSGQCTKSL